MKKITVLMMLISASLVSRSQTAEDSVKTAVNRLFEGMKASDALMISSAFADSAILQSIGWSTDGKTVIKNESVQEFADAVGKLAKGTADERISFDAIRIDGPLAMVWAPYKFYFNGAFNHCGVDAFQLVRLSGVWKIQYLIDTRRKKGCE